MQTSKAISNNTKTLKEKQVDLANRNQEKLKNDKNIFALWKKEMNERISQRPLLVETGKKFY